MVCYLSGRKRIFDPTSYRPSAHVLAFGAVAFNPIISLDGRCVLSPFAFVAKVPVLILEAGLDRLVRSDGIERFRRRVPHTKYRLFDGAYHDLFDETDDIR